VEADRFAALEQLVERYRCVVLLKGAGTLVAGPGSCVHVIEGGNPGMASGGMGDVLTGVIASLLAQGVSAIDAAVAGATLHAAAADAAAARDGQRGLLAADLFDPLRRLVERL
jgi:NAD(P)H-hydrate epimerase